MDLIETLSPSLCQGITATTAIDEAAAAVLTMITSLRAGLDTCLSIMRVLHNGLGESKYRPCPLMVQYVDAGYLGRKTGRGVYDYTR